MSTLDKLLKVAAVLDDADNLHQEVVSYTYTDEDGKEKTEKFKIGVVKRIPMAHSSEMSQINELQRSVFSTRVSQLIVFLDGDRRKLTPQEVDSLDSELVSEFMRAIAKHHPAVFPHLAMREDDIDAKKN